MPLYLLTTTLQCVINHLFNVYVVLTNAMQILFCLFVCPCDNRHISANCGYFLTTNEKQKGNQWISRMKGLKKMKDG